MSGTVLGILGTGRAGTVVARLALKAGYKVLISNSRGPESLSLMVEVLVQGAVAVTSHEAAMPASRSRICGGAGGAFTILSMLRNINN